MLNSKMRNMMQTRLFLFGVLDMTKRRAGPRRGPLGPYMVVRNIKRHPRPLFSP